MSASSLFKKDLFGLWLVECMFVSPSNRFCPTLLGMGWGWVGVCVCVCVLFLPLSSYFHPLSLHPSDPYVKVTLKRKNKSMVTEQTKKRKKVNYLFLKLFLQSWCLCLILIL